MIIYTKGDGDLHICFLWHFDTPSRLNFTVDFFAFLFAGMNRYLRKCKNLNIRDKSILSVLKQVSLFVHTSENRYHINISDEETVERLKDIKHAFDLRDPGQLYVQLLQSE